MSEKRRVYISFAEEDRRQVRGLESKLRAAGLETWFDENDLTSGSDWKGEIEQALRRSDTFLSCVSTRSIGRSGFYNEETAIALELRKERPGFVVPVRLDECALPQVYRDLNLTWVDIFDDAGFERLVRSLATSVTGTQAIEGTSRIVATPRIRILHLSDLHFTRDDDHLQLLNILDEDLGDPRIDHLVVSGDLSDRCKEAGYERAREFLCQLQSKRAIPQERCVLVPGNHDAERDLRSFELRDKVEKRDDAVKVLAGDLDTVLYLVRKAGTYSDRFRLFAAVYRAFTGCDYDLSDPARQFSVAHFADNHIQFVGLNSAWEIDQFRPKRSSIHPTALDEGLSRLRKNPGYLGIAVWHHAITGNGKIGSDEFLGRLSRAGVRLCLHGDVHELRPDVVNPYSSSRIHVVGCGSLAARALDRPESTPRMYNVIEIDRDHARARVSTRQQSRAGAQYEAYATWSVPGQPDLRSGVYEFDLDPPA